MSAAPNIAPNRLPVDEGREYLMLKAARMFYREDKTLTVIAAETGLNRWQVSRLLQEARESGIVRIEIVPRTLRAPELEAGLLRAFGLRDAVVVPGPESLEALAQAAGQYLATIKPPPASIGVSWGRTMAAVAHSLSDGWGDGVLVVQINGTVAPVPGVAYHNNVAEIFARKGNGRMIPLPVPAIVGARLTGEVLSRDRIVADVLKIARSVPVLAFSLGVAGKDSVLAHSGNVTAAEMAGLVGGGAVGDVLGHFIDLDGRIVDAELDSRVIGLTLADLRGCANAVCISGGTAKRHVTLGALRARLFSTLVTDEATATFVLEHDHDCRTA